MKIETTIIFRFDRAGLVKRDSDWASKRMYGNVAIVEVITFYQLLTFKYVGRKSGRIRFC